MILELWGMIAAGAAVLVAGLALSRARLQRAGGTAKIVLLGPAFEAVALAIFAAEHFLAAHDLMSLVPRWLPGPLFWTYFVGVALMAAAISFITRRQIRWSAGLLGLLFVTIVATIDLPNLPGRVHERLMWTLTARELAFAAGALVFAASTCPAGSSVGNFLGRIGRGTVAAVFIFYGIEHYRFPRFVPGVPLEKLTPAWVPAPVMLADMVGTVLILAGLGLLVPRTVRVAAASSGTVLLLLTAFFYIPILVMEIHTPMAVEGINYVGDTLLFASTALLAGFGPQWPQD